MVEEAASETAGEKKGNLPERLWEKSLYIN